MSVEEFDISPSPRVLAVLGDIDLDIWRCLAELIDNSVDGFLKATREGDITIKAPVVCIGLPKKVEDGARIWAYDNGPGMDIETLQNAMKAGWTGNNPIDSLGLFGLGFNIATARLGRMTTVWTTRRDDKEWHGLKIDFDELMRQGHFRTPHLRKAKSKPDDHGTEITVERLNSEQLKWISRAPNRTKLRKELAKTYSSMLRQNGKPIHFGLLIDETEVEARNHCTWNEDRFTHVSGLGDINAVEQIDIPLGEREFCSKCMTWFADQDARCPLDQKREDCGRQMLQRRIYGWIGLQRYLSPSDFGIDFIRNGRKIEIGNKDLFTWSYGDQPEKEYPYDDVRSRGRFVGEIHIDHCRVNYVKDRFDRSDPAWNEMVVAVRGDGPMRRERARELGITNQSVLTKFFRAWQRSNLRKRDGVGWKRILVVKDNELAGEMAQKFHDGVSEFQDDARWYDIVSKQDEEALRQEGGDDEGSDEDSPGPTGFGEDEGDKDKGDEGQDEPIQAKPVIRDKVEALSREYSHEATTSKWIIDAYVSDPEDPVLLDGLPWTMTLVSAAEDKWEFVANRDAIIFQPVNTTVRDALLAELAWRVCEVSRGRGTETSFSTAFADMRARYALDLFLDPQQMVIDAVDTLRQLARAVATQIESPDGRSLMSEFSNEDQEATRQRMAQRQIDDPQDQIDSGEFLEFVPAHCFPEFFSRHPEFFLDGNYWDDRYATINYGNQRINDEARSHVISRYVGLISDAVWIIGQEVEGLENASPDAMIRAAKSLLLLRPSVEEQ